MVIWFAATSLAAVAFIFKSPNLDYRLVIFGSLLPLFEGFFGGRWLLHSLLFNVVMLFAVMLLAYGKRLTQRRWLGLPIGMFSHLILDATWTDTQAFWWPFTGLNFRGFSANSEFENIPESFFLEALGLLIGVKIYYRFLLFDPKVRRILFREGRLVAEKKI